MEYDDDYSSDYVDEDSRKEKVRGGMLVMVVVVMVVVVVVVVVEIEEERWF